MAAGSTVDHSSQKGMKITDDLAYEPILDFCPYSETIVKIVKNSYPKFSLGIYGEWGTGKTTLMKMVERKINETSNDILTVWFNAWRYEREDQFAIVALLKTIAFAMGEHQTYKKIKPILLRAVKIITRGVLSEVAAKFIGEKGVEEFRDSLLPQMDLLAEVDKDTIYFDGIHKIESEMRKIFDNKPSSRIVVFKDDLDRCSPKKALEVLESVKVFLGIDGFIYVMGISHETIAKLISAEYEKSGVKGEQYIKKIIQIPIAIQQWNIDDVEKLVENLLDNNESIPRRCRDVLSKNIGPISKAVEHNPREVKRFLNNFIVAYDIYGSHQRVDPEVLLILQALNVRWDRFYRLIIDNTPEFREDTRRYSELTEDERSKIKEGVEYVPENEQLKFDERFRRLLSDFKSDYELWNLIKQNSSIIFSVVDWDIYRRAGETVKKDLFESRTSPIHPPLIVKECGETLERLLYGKGVIPDNVLDIVLGAEESINSLLENAKLRNWKVGYELLLEIRRRIQDLELVFSGMRVADPTRLIEEARRVYGELESDIRKFLDLYHSWDILPH